MSDQESTPFAYTMRIQVRPGSPLEAKYFQRTAIAPGIAPQPSEDLIFRGGRIVPQMEFQNIFLGTTADWPQGDVESIDAAIGLAMQDKPLNNVMLQYFRGSGVTCDPRPFIVLGNAKPRRLDEPDVQAAVASIYDSGKIKKTDLATTIFNLVLPPGTVLALGGDDSLGGLGGYHGSVHIQRDGKPVTVYYSANVYSQALASGGDNGIVAFKDSWKNVVGTLYHEINEFRTDPDVGDSSSLHDPVLGWTSSRGREVGDQPLFVAGFQLQRVLQEVAVAASPKRVPVQFMYSNAVHGAEGPIANPHA